MGRTKNTDEVQDISVYPDGYEMNAWENNEGREIDISASRKRIDDKRPAPLAMNNTYRAKLWFPVNQIPDGWQYGWFTERLLNEPQGDNLQEAYESGWDFVKQSDHPDYIVRELHTYADNRIRRRNSILMKKPKEDYMLDQRGHIEESALKQREISYLTDYFGQGSKDPRFVVENSGSYTPSYTNKRG